MIVETCDQYARTNLLYNYEMQLDDWHSYS
jgi:hypothetical protein